MALEDREVTTERLRRVAKLIGQYDARKSGREIGEIVAKIERLREDLDHGRETLSDIEEKIEKWELPRKWEFPSGWEAPREWVPQSIEWEESGGGRSLYLIGIAFGVLLLIILLVGVFWMGWR